MFRKRLSAVGVASVLGIVVGGCSDADPAARNKAGETGQLDISKAKSWKGGIEQLFVQKCGSCHPGYTSYAGVTGKLSGANGVQARINDNTMPRGGLGETLKATVNDWIAAGAPESDPAGAAPGK